MFFKKRSTTVKNGQYGQKRFKPVKIVQNDQWGSKAVNTVKNIKKKRSKMVKNGEKKRVNKVKNGQKRLTTVKTGQYGQNWFLINQNSQQR